MLSVNSIKKALFIELCCSKITARDRVKEGSGIDAPINVKPTGEGGRRGIGWGFDRSLWPGGRAFELSCCPRGRDI